MKFLRFILWLAVFLCLYVVFAVLLQYKPSEFGQGLREQSAMIRKLIQEVRPAPPTPEGTNGAATAPDSGQTSAGGKETAGSPSSPATRGFHRNLSTARMLIVIAGGVTMLVGGLWLLVVCFRESILWGLGVLFIPFVGLIFVIMHWDQAKNPFCVNVAGVLVVMAGAVL